MFDKDQDSLCCLGFFYILSNSLISFDERLIVFSKISNLCMIFKIFINFNWLIVVLLIKILSALAFIGSIFWFIAEPNFEPAILAISSLASFILLLIKDNKTKVTPLQNQTVKENGFGVQAGGNVNIGNVNMDKENPKNVK